jgi:DNA primase
VLAALDAYVKDCARRLWRPSGRAVREYLTEKRRLPADVLAANLVGADPGPGLQARPDGVPRRSGAVFPTVEGARAVYAQLRRLHPGPDQPRYLSLASRLAPNPGLARYRPSEPVGGPVIVTEGPIDALAAAAAGFEGVALFGVGRAGADAARTLAQQRRPVVLAFDADDAGRAATLRLGALLRELGCRSTSLCAPEAAGDLAGWLATSADWRATLQAAVRLATVARDRGNEIAIG